MSLKTMDKLTLLAYRMMGWLNEQSNKRSGRGGAFETPYGILEIYHGHAGNWEYRYLQTEPLPTEITKEEGEGWKT